MNKSMKNLKLYIKSGVVAAFMAVTASSCNSLDLAPIDYYGSGSYWQSEEHVIAYIDGIHNHMRSATWQNTMTFGEMRGSTWARTTVVADGSVMNSGTIRLQNLSQASSGVSKFGDLFGRITNCNLFIIRVSEATYLSEERKNYYLGQIYGVRAYYYFLLHRTYGGVPLRTDINVIEGELDPEKLYMPRATPAEVLALIKSDIDMSLELFGSVNEFDPFNIGRGKSYWSKAATEALAADVYLWSAKVNTEWQIAGETAAPLAANPADITTAKSHLMNLMANYNLALEPSLTDVFDVNNKDNEEVIFTVRNLVGEYSNNFAQFVYSTKSGSTITTAVRADGTPWGDPLSAAGDVIQGYEYSEKLYQMYDAEDARRDDTFLISYTKDTVNNTLDYYGSYFVKNIGHVNSEGLRVYDGDYIIYRAAWVYLSLAEVANFEGNNADVVRYINMVRERAYGDAWDVALHGYVAGDFKQNELAILNERTKEFVGEGYRWWDLRRMTETKGGTPLVFVGDASIYGEGNPTLDPATEAHEVLWPVDQTLLSSDPLIKQTPGYEVN